MLNIVSHPLASVTVTVYVPATRPEIEEVVAIDDETSRDDDADHADDGIAVIDDRRVKQGVTPPHMPFLMT